MQTEPPIPSLHQASPQEEPSPPNNVKRKMGKGQRKVASPSLASSPPPAQPPAASKTIAIPPSKEALRRRAEAEILLAEGEAEERSVSGSLASSLVASWMKSAAKLMSGTASGSPNSLGRLASSGPKESGGMHPSLSASSTHIIHRSGKSESITTSMAVIIPPSVDASASTSRQQTFIDAGDSICAFPNCVRTLNIATSRFHCRRCNGWYCGQHSGHPSLAMKLAVGTGEPDASKGLWSRVCLRCFATKFYEQPTSCTARSWNDSFCHLRQRGVERADLEASRLERRLAKLSDYSSDTRLMAKVPLRVYEQQIVPWQNDASATACPFCQTVFNTLNRKHHCRLCGKVICGEATCCVLFPIRILGQLKSIRICINCDRVIFRKRTMAKQLEAKGELYQLYSRLHRVRQQIFDILPKFEESLGRFEAEIHKTSFDAKKASELRQEASTARDTLLLLFRHMESLAQQIRYQPAEPSSQMEFLQRSIHRAAISFLQQHMITLQRLPALDARQQSVNEASATATTPHLQSAHSAVISASTTSISFLESLSLRLFGHGPHRYSHDESSTSSMQHADLSNVPKPITANAAALNLKLETFQEQKIQLENLIADAVHQRRLEDVCSLRLALEDINREIQTQRTICASLDPGSQK